jgi:hypothetical protein
MAFQLHLAAPEPEPVPLEMPVAEPRPSRLPRDPFLPGDRGYPPRRAGKIQPRRFSALTMLRATGGGIIRQFLNVRVPDEFWSRDADPAGPIAIVACPCGEEPEVPENQTGECGCGRFYLYVGNRVLTQKTPDWERQPKLCVD